MPVNIQGTPYKKVVERLNEFHSDHKENKSIITEIIQFKDGIVVIKAAVKIGENVFTGHAYEEVGSSQVNQNSALENGETSAIGRALASAGYAGSEFASADELVTALGKQGTSKPAFKPQPTNFSNDDWRDKAIGFKSGKNQGKSYREVDEETLVWIINDCKVEDWKTKAIAEMKLREKPEDAKSESVQEEADDLGF